MGCANTIREESYASSEPHNTETGNYETETITHADTVRNATNIVTAQYLETVQAFRGNEYVYEVQEELKGSVGCNSIYLITVEYVEASNAMPVSGENVILFLSKYSSVYYSHDDYIVMDIAEDTEEERSLISALSAENVAETNKSGHVFTRSTNLTDILAVTESIFVVSPKEIYVVGVKAPTTTYSCTVLSAIKGQPEFSEILVTFFNDTVTLGENYVVLLAARQEGGKVYTLSSPYSVLIAEEALETPELKPLLEKAQNVTAPDLPSEDEIHASEQSSLIVDP